MTVNFRKSTATPTYITLGFSDVNSGFILLPERHHFPGFEEGAEHQRLIHIYNGQV